MSCTKRRSEDKEKGEGIGQLLLSNRCKHGRGENLLKPLLLLDVRKRHSTQAASQSTKTPAGVSPITHKLKEDHCFVPSPGLSTLLLDPASIRCPTLTNIAVVDGFLFKSLISAQYMFKKPCFSYSKCHVRF